MLGGANDSGRDRQFTQISLFTYLRAQNSVRWPSPRCYKGACLTSVSKAAFACDFRTVRDKFERGVRRRIHPLTKYYAGPSRRKTQTRLIFIDSFIMSESVPLTSQYEGISIQSSLRPFRGPI